MEKRRWKEIICEELTSPRDCLEALQPCNFSCESLLTPETHFCNTSSFADKKHDFGETVLRLWFKHFVPLEAGSTYSLSRVTGVIFLSTLSLFK